VATFEIGQNQVDLFVLRHSSAVHRLGKNGNSKQPYSPHWASGFLTYP